MNSRGHSPAVGQADGAGTHPPPVEMYAPRGDEKDAH